MNHVMIAYVSKDSWIRTLRIELKENTPLWAYPMILGELVSVLDSKLADIIWGCKVSDKDRTFRFGGGYAHGTEGGSAYGVVVKN